MSTLLLILKLLPTILNVVQAIEAAIPLPGSGKAKLELLMSTVSDVFETDPALKNEVSKDRFTALFQGAVQRVVASFNVLGIFHKAVA